MVLYFDPLHFNPSDTNSVLGALQYVYGNMDTSTFEIVYVSAAPTLAEFNSRFSHHRSMHQNGWLAVPFSHVRKRQALRELYEVGRHAEAVVILDDEVSGGARGRVITREGAKLLRLAHAAQRSIFAEKDAVNSGRRRLQRTLDASKMQLRQRGRAVAPLRAALAQRAAELATGSTIRQAEVSDFMSEPAVPPEKQAALDDARAALDEAKRRVSELAAGTGSAPSAFAQLRLEQSPAHEIREAVEAVAVVLDVKAEFAHAQARMMRDDHALPTRLADFDPRSLPARASTRLRNFAATPGSGGGDDLAAVLRAWVVSVLRVEEAEVAVSASVDTTTIDPAMLTACECVCDLAGLEVGIAGEGDLLGALLMAAAFPGAPLADDAEEAAEENELSKLNDTVGLLQAGVDDLTRDLTPGAGRDGAEQQYLRLDHDLQQMQKREYAAAISASVQPVATGKLSMTTEQRQTASLVTGALLALVMPSLLTDEQADVFGTAFGQWHEVEQRLSGLRNQIFNGAIGPEQWGRAKQMHESVQSAFGRQNFDHLEGLEGFYHMNDLVTKAIRFCESTTEKHQMRQRLEAMRQELAQAQARLDKAEAEAGGNGFNPALIQRVAKACREGGTPLPRERILWALERAKTADSDPIETCLAQPAARRALALLSDVRHMKDFDVDKHVTAAAVQRCKEALKNPDVRGLVDELRGSSVGGGFGGGDGGFGGSQPWRFMTCPNGHKLREDKRAGNYCYLCGRCAPTGRRGTAFRCSQGCDYDVCLSCGDPAAKKQGRKRGRHAEEDCEEDYEEDYDEDYDEDGDEGMEDSSDGMPCINMVVEEAANDENSVIALSPSTMEELELSRGDIVLIKGKQSKDTACVVRTDETCGAGKIRMNNCVRKNLKVLLGDVVSVRPTLSVMYGERVHVEPVEDSLEGVTGDLLADVLKPYFEEQYRPVCEGDFFTVRCGDKAVEFKVVETDPAKYCVVAPKTVVHCEGEPIKREVTEGMEVEVPEAEPAAVEPAPVENGTVTEAAMLRWVMAVCELDTLRRSLEPLEVQVAQLTRQLAQLDREAKREGEARYREILRQARDAGLPEGIFPRSDPWEHFPWTELSERSDCEEELRRAVGLRDAARLQRLLRKARRVGIDKAR